MPERGAVVALAGRRIDAPGATPARFPLEQVPLVRQRLRGALQELNAGVVVASAACGADLLALELAGELGLRSRIVLPFARERFRESSVIDRPGDWGGLFDRVTAQATEGKDLVILEEAGHGENAYAATNRAILDEAVQLATVAGSGAIATLVWDGKSRGEGDLTEGFGRLARERGLQVRMISTLSGN